MNRNEGKSRVVGFRAFCMVAISLASLTVFACGDSLSGKYEAFGEAAGAASVEFKSGKAYLTIIGTTTETDYEVKDDKVIFKNGGGAGQNLVMTIEKDGSLSGPLGMSLKKKT